VRSSSRLDLGGGVDVKDDLANVSISAKGEAAYPITAPT
jgi:hypothetical protein